MSTRWDPLKDIMNLSDRMNRMFQDSFQAGEAGQWQPPVDIYESADEIVILAELPGISEENIDIQVNSGLLLIRGEKPSPVDRDSESYYRLERPFGKFARSFSVPNNVDMSSVTASLKDGVLVVTLKRNTQTGTVSVKVTRD